MPSKLWWLSWNQAADPNHGLDSRPTKWPPPVAVLAFWESGFAGDGSYTTVVALVRAQTEALAKDVVERAWKPGVGEWRFCDEHDAAAPPGDRFPAPEWSVTLGRWPWSTVERI